MKIKLKMNSSDFLTAQSCMLFENVKLEKAEKLLTELIKNAQAEQISYEKGKIIYSPEFYRKSLGIILKGEAFVEKSGGVLLNILKEGECFGAAALFASSERYVTTIRAKNECEVLFITAAGMNTLFAEEPKIAACYITFLSGRIQFLNHKIDSFTAPSAQQSLLQYLQDLPCEKSCDLEEAQEYEKFVLLPIPLAKIAEALNLGRSSLYRAMQNLEAQGIIRRVGKKIYLREFKK